MLYPYRTVKWGQRIEEKKAAAAVVNKESVIADSEPISEFAIIMIERKGYIDKAHSALRTFPVCALLGPRQCGKTILGDPQERIFSPTMRYIGRFLSKIG